MKLDAYLTPEAGLLAANTLDRLHRDPDAKPSAEHGDLAIDGFHALRAGSIVVVFTLSGQGAIDHGTEAKAEGALADLA
jgi:hypothetical protein